MDKTSQIKLSLFQWMDVFNLTTNDLHDPDGFHREAKDFDTRLYTREEFGVGLSQSTCGPWGLAVNDLISHINNKDLFYR